MIYKIWTRNYNKVILDNNQHYEYQYSNLTTDIIELTPEESNMLFGNSNSAIRHETKVSDYYKVYSSLNEKEFIKKIENEKYILCVGKVIIPTNEIVKIKFEDDGDNSL